MDILIKNVYSKNNFKIPELNPIYPSLSRDPVKQKEFTEIMQNTTNLNISFKSKIDIENAAQDLIISIQFTVYNASYPNTTSSTHQANNHALPLYSRPLISDKRRVQSRWQKYHPSDKQIFNNLSNTIKKLIFKTKNEYFERKYQSLNSKDIKNPKTV